MHLGNILFTEAEMFVNSQDILPDRDRGHAVSIVRHTTQSVGTLASSEGHPPRVGAALLGMDCKQTYSKKKNWVKDATTYELPNPSCRQCPLFTKPPISQNKECGNTSKCLPSGPKKSSSGLPYRSTRGSLIRGVCPGISISMIA